MANDERRLPELRFIDLHVHTWYSDSSLSPADAVEQAARAGVGVLAIADHEGFQGSALAAPLCADAGIRLIPAAELECEYEGGQYHVLCYGADIGDARLTALAARSRAALDRMSDVLIERLAGDYPQVSLEDYARFERDRSLGGWKALEYLMRRGVTGSLAEGMPLYARYGVTYGQAGFPSLDTLLDVIHGARGRAVLAHPGHTLKSLDEGPLLKRVEALLEHGMDGVECYYPLHAPALTERLAHLCRARGLMITAGSDCHGTFGHSRVGEMNVTRNQIDLRGL